MRKTFLLMGLLMPMFLFSQQIQKQTALPNGEKIGFLEYKPTDYNANTSTKYPIIIFLHGIGERGNGTTELNRVKNISIPHYIDRGSTMRFNWNGKWETFLVLSPQCPMKYGMWPISYVDAMITYAEKNLRIDKNRIFLAGLSMGGGGIWQYASASLANASKLAAIATVCAPPTLTNGCNIAKANLPMWSFHATDDQTVNISSLTNAINKVNSCSPAIPPIKTIFTSGGHYVWDRAFDMEHKYQNPNVFEWFLSQGQKTVAPNKAPIANAGNTITTDKPETVMLNGNGSKDPDGWIAKFAWKKLSGPSGGILSSAAAAISKITGIAIPGSYKFELQVTDNRGSTAKAVVTVNIIAKGNASKPPPISSANRAPLARITGKMLITLPTNSVTLSAATSFDQDGWIAGFNWMRISGPSSYRIANPNARQTTINNLQPGAYVFRLTVKDNKGAGALVEIKVVVNAAPVVKAGPDITITAPNNYVFLSGHQTTDNGGWVVSYKWAKIAGPNVKLAMKGNTSQATLRDLVPGVYLMRLTAVDNNGLSAYDDVYVTVKSAPKTPVRTTATPPAQELPGASKPADNAAIAAPTVSAAAYTLSLYPNPTVNTINIRCNAPATGKAMIMLYDFSGRLAKSIMLEKNQPSFTSSIDVSSLVRGMYTVTVKINNALISSEKFVKQ